MQTRNVLNSPRLSEFKKNQRKIVLVKIFLSLIAFLAIFFSLSYLSHISILNIKEIEVVDGESVDSEKIKLAMEKIISGNYLGFFPKTNVLLYSENKMRKKLFEEFPVIKEVSFFIKDRKILQVKVVERTASYLWCGEVLSEVDGEVKCYFLDNSGFIFSEASYFSGEVYFKFYGPGNIGTHFSKEYFEELIYFKDALTAIGLKPVSLHILQTKDMKIFLSKSNKNRAPYLILKIDSDLKNMIENLETALATEPLRSNFKNKYSSLEYIDLRFGNKIYYKFK